MWNRIHSFLLSVSARAQLARDDAGQAMVEYTLIVALISIVAVALITTVGNDIESTWKTVTEKF